MIFIYYPQDAFFVCIQITELVHEIVGIAFPLHWLDRFNQLFCSHTVWKVWKSNIISGIIR